MLRMLKTVYQKAFTPANCTVQESDSSFFEGFTALAWRQENKRLRAASEGEKDADKPPPNEIQFGTRPKLYKLNKNESELLYIEVLYTVKHKIGVTSGSHSTNQQDLYQYAKEAFSLSADDHAFLLAKATEEKPPIVVLNVTVIEAAGLEAKDADGFSDPYCMLGIMPGQPSPSVENALDKPANEDSVSPLPSPKHPKGHDFYSPNLCLKTPKGHDSLSSSPKSPKSHDSLFFIPSSKSSKGHESTSPQASQKTSKGLESGSTSSTPSPKTPKGQGSRRFSLPRRKSHSHSLAVRDHLPARLIRTTDVKPNTLNPVWKEKFRFDLDNANTDKLHLDIWDHDDEFSVIEAAKKLNEVSGLKGLNRFFKQVAQSARTKNSGDSVDDFLGCVNIPLETIPSTGMDTWYPLEGRTVRSHVQGKIHLKLHLATREDRGIPEDDNWTDVMQHEDLMRMFVRHELRLFNDASYKWPGELPPAALTILHQHAIQGDVTEVQQAVCRWMAYSHTHMEQPLSYELLLQLLDTLNTLWEPESLSREEEECLARSFQSFIDYSVSLLRQIRKVFPPTISNAFHRLEGQLRCLHTIYTSQAFRHCCPFHSELHSDVLAVVKKGNIQWYESVTNTRKPYRQENDSNLHRLTDLTNKVNMEIYRAYHTYNAIFEKWTNVHYFSTTYRQLEKRLAEELNQEIAGIMRQHDCDREPSGHEDTPTSMGTALFELYLALQEFSGYTKHLSLSEQQALTISKYYEWFPFAVSRWLHIARHRAEHRIRTAVEQEKIAQAEAAVKYSASAVDVCCCFSQMMEFWTQLDWPDKEGAVGFVYRLAQIVCDCATLYVELVHTKIITKDLCDEEEDTAVIAEICITVNNMEHVRRSLQPLPSLLDVCEVQQALELVAALAADCPQTSLQTLIKASDQDMVKKILDAVDKLTCKIRPDIRKDIFHLRLVPETLPAEEAIRHLLEYLDDHLLVLNKSLMKANFDRLLACLWSITLQEFKAVMDAEEMRPPSFYQRMFDVLGLLVDFFFANGRGLEMEDILVDEFQILRKKLTMHKMDTISLIEEFYVEKSEQQRGTSCTEFGVLNIRVVYKHYSHVLAVEVLSAKDLIPLDANGLSDPYVVVSLCPDHVFPNQSEISTKIVKKTLNPTFDESFEFPVLPSQCRRRGAVLVFTMMDHDVLFQNDFGGEGFLPLGEVPGINGEEVSSFDALNVISLPLIHPVVVDDGALSILRGRTWDTEAQEFVRKRSLIEDLAAA